MTRMHFIQCRVYRRSDDLYIQLQVMIGAPHASTAMQLFEAWATGFELSNSRYRISFDSMSMVTGGIEAKFDMLDSLSIREHIQVYFDEFPDKEKEPE